VNREHKDMNEVAPAAKPSLTNALPALPRARLTALRAWLQGVPIDVIAARYLDDEDGEIPDARVAHRMILAMRDMMMQRAEQHGRPEIAALFVRPPRHSDVGMSRAGAGLGEIEALGIPEPQPGHGVQLWFAPVLARRLRAAQILTIGEVHSRIRERGPGWWRQIPKIGAKAARTLETWCAAIPAPATDIVLPEPLERQRYSADLDGQGGLNRGTDCDLAASDDLEAIQTWLTLWSSPETARAYRREAERFRAWCVHERGKPLSSAMVEDVQAYRLFLADPQPADRWIGPALPRDRAGWRPFVGPLTQRSALYAEKALRSLFTWLCKRGYLRRNPCTALPRQVKQRRKIQIQKALSPDNWSAFTGWLANQALDQAHMRVVRAAVILLRDSGMRCSEAAGARRDQLRRVVDADVHGLWGELDVMGKGGFERAVPISVEAYEALKAHWADRADSEELGGPLIAPLTRPATPRAAAKSISDGYSTRGLRQLVSKAYERFVAELPVEAAANVQPRIAPHALRHTFGTHAVDSGVDLDVIQAWLGHADPATTTLYTRPGEQRRRQQIDKLFSPESERTV
jgi:site-specific recombinase XerD